MQLSERAQLKKNTYDPETRTVQAIAATEAPIEVFSFEVGGLVREILLMDGLELPTGQVPLLDTHSRNSVWAVLGHASGFYVQGDELHCEIELSSEARADGTATKISEGHLTDISVGYEIYEAEPIREGQTKFYGTRSVDGPAMVVTSWRIRELSICAIGADDRAKIRSYNGGNNTMPENNTTTRKNETEIRADERERVSEIAAMCERYKCPEIGKRMIESGASVQETGAKVLDFLDKTQPDDNFPSYRVSVGVNDSEKKSAAIVDGLCTRAGVQVEKPAGGYEDFAHRSLSQIAETVLQDAGVRTSGMNPARIITEALSARSHSTSDFPAILSGVASKTLRTEYELAPASFEQWVGISSAQDFRPIHRTQLSEAPGLVEVPELSEFQYGSFGESEEIYQLITLGRMFSISRQAVVNDNLSAFVRIPRAFAASAKRQINKMVYAILSENPNMSDSTSLFDAAHGNLYDGNAAPSIAVLSTARSAMRLQTGLQDEILNVNPRFCITPASLETEVDELLTTAQGYDTDGAGRANPFYKRLEPVVEPLLDGVSGVPYFLAADARMIDTIELAFLNGVTTPTIETRQGWTVDGVEYKIRIDVGAKALDWRGLYKIPSE